MAILGFELEEIAQIIALVESRDLAELTIEEEGRYLRVRGPRFESASLPAVITGTHAIAMPSVGSGLTMKSLESQKVSLGEMPMSAPKSLAASKRAKRSEASLEETPGCVRLISPMVGVFYRAEKPGAPPLVNVGDRVEVGQTVGVLEAMKVFSEFKSDYAGVIMAILVEDGQLVESGTPLMVIQTDNP